MSYLSKALDFGDQTPNFHNMHDLCQADRKARLAHKELKTNMLDFFIFWKEGKGYGLFHSKWVISPKTGASARFLSWSIHEPRWLQMQGTSHEAVRMDCKWVVTQQIE